MWESQIFKSYSINKPELLPSYCIWLWLSLLLCVCVTLKFIFYGLSRSRKQKGVAAFNPDILWSWKWATMKHLEWKIFLHVRVVSFPTLQILSFSSHSIYLMKVFLWWVTTIHLKDNLWCFCKENLQLLKNFTQHTIFILFISHLNSHGAPIELKIIFFRQTRPYWFIEKRKCEIKWRRLSVFEVFNRIVWIFYVLALDFFLCVSSYRRDHLPIQLKVVDSIHCCPFYERMHILSSFW